MKLTQNIAYVWITLLLSACGATTVDQSIAENIKTNTSPQIIFLTYQVNKDANQVITVKLTNRLMAEGTLKADFDEQSYVVGDYLIIQLDSEGNSLAEKHFKSPLIQLIEYVNSEGEFEKKSVSFDAKEVSIRLQLHSQATFILLQELGNENVNFVKTKI